MAFKVYLFRALLALPLALTAGTAPAEPEMVSREWWLDAHFDAVGQNVFSIPASELNNDWKRVSPLTPESIEKFRSASHEDPFAKFEFRFELTSDLTQDSKEERIAVGVYETGDGQAGRFIIVVEPSSTGSWQKAFISAVPGYHNFSALLVVDREIRWYSCMLCGDFETLRWEHGAYFLE
jgi:hypothetical protein